MAKRIEIDARKDEDGNLLLIAVAGMITRRQRDALILSMPTIRSLPFDGSIDAIYLDGDHVIIEQQNQITVIASDSESALQ